MRNPNRLKARFIALALAAGLMTSSCIGPFNTWHQVLHWNRSVSQNKWAAEGIFLGFVIIPVYSLAFIADAVVFNSIEFWGAKNPVPPAPYTSNGDGPIESQNASASTGLETVEVTEID